MEETVSLEKSKTRHSSRAKSVAKYTFPWSYDRDWLKISTAFPLIFYFSVSVYIGSLSRLLSEKEETTNAGVCCKNKVDKAAGSIVWILKYVFNIQGNNQAQIRT